jgi:hypothetical protein
MLDKGVENDWPSYIAQVSLRDKMLQAGSPRTGNDRLRRQEIRHGGCSLTVQRTSG